MLLFNLLRFRFKLFYNEIGKKIWNNIERFMMLICIMSIVDVTIQLGFHFDAATLDYVCSYNRLLLLLIAILLSLKLLPTTEWKFPTAKELIYTLLILSYAIWIYGHSEPANFATRLLAHKHTLQFALVGVSVYEISRIGISFLSQKVSPTVLFAASFFFFIIIGSGLLMLPRSNHGSLTAFDALFTATSAVCVTGLSVIDTVSCLTTFGQVILMVLIQIGGIGVMTFTSFFALSLSHKASIKNQMVIKDLVSADNMNDIFQTLKRIIFVTLTIELAASWLIFNELEANTDFDLSHRIFFAAFHAISGFCNAGFSIAENGMMNPIFADNHFIGIIVALTIVLGGMGFPLQSNLISWVQYKIKKIYYRLAGKHERLFFRSHLLNVNSRLVFFTHLGLLLLGMGIFIVSERHHSQIDMSAVDRIFESFFLSTTARTAGFNTVDLGLLGPHTIMIMLILMWIGCAPLSTGGGIKTSTFAVAMFNMFSVFRKTDRIEIYNRRVEQESVNKAFAIIMLSILLIFVSTMLTKSFDPQFGIMQLLFENCSAISTVGLTLDLTPHLSVASKTVLIINMFIGRIGVLSFVMCFVGPKRFKSYSFPHESITL